MSSGSLTTTSYAILGLLAIKPWTTYELTQQMDRSLGRIWPRAVSKLYEEPKKLVAAGLALASHEAVGKRSRTVYSITAKGRRALASWLADPGGGPVLEFEQLLKVFFSENGTKRDTLETLAATSEWAKERSSESLEVGRRYLAGEGPFPGRAPQLELTSRFLTDFYAFVGEWAAWATEIVEAWPDDPRAAVSDPHRMEETVRRAARAAAEPAGRD
jgi:DNA-binding PadR family transcriptional regulator